MKMQQMKLRPGLLDAYRDWVSRHRAQPFRTSSRAHTLTCDFCGASGPDNGTYPEHRGDCLWLDVEAYLGGAGEVYKLRRENEELKRALARARNKI
jgi:hypothetical protein